MPEAKSPTGDSSALTPDAGAVIPRMSLGEQGVLGLVVRNRRIIEEAQAAFRYPAFIQTVQEMRNNPTVGSAMNVYRMLISRVTWDFNPPVDASPTDIARANAVKSMMDDMEHSWGTFIESVVPYLEYGFGINEKVLRRRLTRNGSKYNDGLVGIRKLPTRSQETIQEWRFSDDGANLVAVAQSLRNLENGYRFQSRTNDHGFLEMDRDKFLLFSASSTKGNPQGNSIFKTIYLAFKQMTVLQEQELVGIAKDVQGMLKIGLPPQYLSPDASPSDKAVADAFKQIIDNYNAGTQRGLLVPVVNDPDTKLPMFTYDLMDAKGLAKYDTEAVIKRLQGDILSALSVDILKLGENAGSFSLADAKTSVLTLAIDYRLKEIKEVLNSDLRRTLYTINGWSTERMGEFVYSDIEEVSLEEFSKAIQRVASTSMIEVDRAVLNRIRSVLKMPLKPDDEPVDKEALSATLTGQITSAGDGMAVGTTGDGTSKNPTNGKDRSSSNSNNKA